METIEEFEKVVETLTPFQKRVLKAIERAPSKMANTWEICWNDFAKEWNAKRSSHGALFRCILQAGQAMQDKKIIVILAPRDQYDTYTYASLRQQKRTQQGVQSDEANVPRVVKVINSETGLQEDVAIP